MTSDNQEATPTPYVWPETRDASDVEEARELFEALVRNFLSTAPSKGSETEVRKFEVAEQTIDLFWRLFGILGFWAQAHIVGRTWAMSDLAFANQLAKLWGMEHGIEHDSHILEYFGSEYGRSSSVWGEPIFHYLAENEELEEKTELSDQVLRSAMRQLITSDCRRSAYWRRPLMDALEALNYGQIVSPLTPSESRRRSDFFETLSLKRAALCHLNFQVGKGIKKHVALDKVAAVLNQSPETIRSWEKQLRDDEEYQADAYAARLAGQFEDELKTRSVADMVEEYGDEALRNVTYWQRAKFQMARAQHYPLERIRDEMNAVRAEKKVSKRSGKTPEKR